MDVSHCRLPFGPRVDADGVTLVAHQPLHRDTRHLHRMFAQRDGLVSWRHAAAVLADVEVNQHADRDPSLRRCLADALQARDRIDRNREPEPLGEHSGTPAFVAIDDLIRDQDVRRERRNGFCFRHRRTGEAGARSPCQLPLRDLGRLVGLEMGSQLALHATRNTAPFG